jgi:peptide/nickel transport system substrate-binding protein
MYQTVGKPSRWLLLLVALAMVAAACAPGDDAAEPEDDADTDTPVTDEEEDPAGEPQEGGTVVFGHEQEPQVLNPHLTEGNLRATALTTHAILLSAYEVTPDFQYVPELLDGEAEVEEGPPFRVTYNIREEATWSDGTPVSAEDFEFHWETMMNEEWGITSREGYDLITSAEINDEKSITFEFEDIFVPYRTLFSQLIPAHALEGEDFNEIWTDGVVTGDGEPIASGPFIFDEWERGQQLSIVRNEDWWGEEPAMLDQVVYRYIEETPTLVQQIRGGEIDMFDPQPQVDLIEQLEGIGTVTVDVDAGPVWEHIDFNYDNPLLAERYVREAIIRGIDREAVVDTLVRPVNPDAEVLQNTIYVPNQQEYESVYDEYEYDPEQARSILEENGCTEGDGGIFECNGEPLEFRYVSVAGNERRELMFEIVQAQLAEVGIQLDADFSEAADSLGTKLPSGDFDIINFAWSGSPDPFGGNSIWTCGEREDSLNYNAYCNEEVADLINQTNTLLDEQERADTYNEAAALIAEDIPMVPMFQLPDVLAFDENVGGAGVNATQWTPLWNAQEWFLNE